jgi:hypothetical protein
MRIGSLLSRAFAWSERRTDDAAPGCSCPKKKTVVVGVFPDVAVLTKIDHEAGCTSA